ncbi:piezo-type mechanosensitive ion channel component-like [Diaphorina citri]|uniref:Piezo-type mechanosensitive ion channel component-like n=1 Tax=Diaphorina citri TaxID=121845 RepID=A0A3Q0JIM1_DIACI|nr:piezo-type mechanosensitive ion channel component-like [Diaphorina citri]
MVLFLSMKHLSIVKLESKLKQQNKTFAGGSNEQIEDFTNSTNPTRNYYQYMYSSVDVIKTYLFGTSFWVTLTCVFAIYKSQPYMFSLGYLTSVFLLLWLGNEFYLKSPKQILKYMNALIFYTLFVILVKIVLLVSHSEKINLRQLCYYFEFFVPITIQKESRYDLECQIDANNIDLFWDAICFSIFLFQKRIFRSYYFLHVVTKTKYMVLEASRGQKKIAEIEQENYKIYQAKNMKNYLRVRRRVKEMDSNLQLQGRAPRYHHEALRSGDYYMFSHIDKFINSNKTPKSNKISPKGQETSPKGQETSPKDQETSPKDQETSPKDQETSPKDQETSPKDQETSPKDQETSPKDQETSPKDQETSPKDQETSPKDQETSPKDQETSPKDQETSPKDQETSAEGETKEYRTRSAKYWHYTVSLFEKLTIALIKWFDDKSKSYYSTRETINKEKQEYYRKTVEINEDNTNETKPEENFIEITFVENNNIFRTEKMAKPSLKQEKVMSKETNLLLQLYFSVYHSIISNTTIIMYAVIIVHQATTASLLNLPISLFLFLWGSLSVPRPSVSFWIFLITYVEIMIVIKFVFSFETIKWNIFETDDVFFPPKFVGVSKSERISFMDICLLLVLFHHRHVLKSWGLWAQASFPESTKSTEKLIVTESMSAIKNVWLCLKKYMQPITEFLVSVFKEKRETINKDVYLYMFICDFFIFAILFAKFDSFVPPDEATDVSEYFQIKQSRKFTLTYVLFLISQFFLILADRVLYLRKFLKGKIVFDMVQIIGFHVLIFFVHPIYTNRYFKESLFPQLTFIIKSTYFAISSYIIRFGYPKKMVGNILQKDNVGLLHKYIYQLYMLIPFLHEMRTIMDWIWTDTSLTLGEWFRHEDIYTKLYLIRCDAQADDASPYPKGVKYPLSRKYLFGFLILSLIILCIWFPILLFTDYGFESGAQPDLPVEFKLTVRLEAYPPMYIQIVHKTQLVPYVIHFWISDEAYGLLLHQYTSSTEARRLLKAFNHKLVFAAPFDPQSSWQISPEQATNLEKQLKCTNNSTDPPNCQVKMTVTVDMQKEKDTVTATHSVQLLNETKTALSKALFENTGNNTITIKNVFPKFVKSSSEHVFLSQLMSFDSKVSNQHFFDVNMTLKFSPDGKSLKNATTAWTTIHSDYSNMSQKTVIEILLFQF